MKHRSAIRGSREHPAHRLRAIQTSRAIYWLLFDYKACFQGGFGLPQGGRPTWPSHELLVWSYLLRPPRMANECFSQCEQPSEFTCPQQPGAPKLRKLCLPDHLAPILSSLWELFISLLKCKIIFVIFACTASVLYSWKDLFQRLKSFSLTHCFPNISLIKNTLLFHVWLSNSFLLPLPSTPLPICLSVTDKLSEHRQLLTHLILILPEKLHQLVVRSIWASSDYQMVLELLFYKILKTIFHLWRQLATGSPNACMQKLLAQSLCLGTQEQPWT